MNFEQHINAFAKLSCFMMQFSENGNKNNMCASNENLNELFFERFEKAIRRSEQLNPWFTAQSTRMAISGIADMATREKLELWVRTFPTEKPVNMPLTIAVIMAGNLPLVGFHDFISVLFSGHRFLGKMSSKDTVLLPLLAEVLIQIEPKYKDFIQLTADKISGFDAVIATGSNNSARYFEYYFGKHPNIIRKNRNSIAVLTGTETPEMLENLAHDIYAYFGLGCRNVSKIFLPKNFDITKILPHFEAYANIVQHNKYANNYDYNSTIFSMNRVQHLDNGFMLFREAKELSSPISVMHYDFYNSNEEILEWISFYNNELQCIVGQTGFIENEIPFGKAQFPELTDYADNLNVPEFLFKLNF